MKLKIGELSPTASGTAPPATHTIPLQTLYYLSCILSYTHIHFINLCLFIGELRPLMRVGC